MSDDDKPHEYVPQIVTETMSARLQMPVLRERLAAMTAERNNLAEAVREVNARLVEVTAERDAARQSRKRLVALVNYWRASAEDWKECFHGVEETLTEAETDRDYYREALAKADVELTQLRAKMEDDGR